VVIDTTPNDPDLCHALELATDVTLIRASGNIGYGRACNLGIEWALNNTSCEFFLLLNNDAVVFPESIGVLEAAMESCPEVGIMAPRIACLNNPAALWYGGGEMDWRRASAFTPGFNEAADAPLAMTERDVTFASGCALFIRRPVAMRLGGFDPRFFMYEEDVELCLRTLEEGIRIRYIPRSLVLHRAQGSSRESANDREDFWSCESPSLPFYAFHVMRNRMLNIKLHAHGWRRLVAVTFFPLMLVRRAVPFLVGGRADAVAAMFGGVAESLRTGAGTRLARSQNEALKGTPDEVGE
jgi:GT2 family glycosyltransferase